MGVNEGSPLPPSSRGDHASGCPCTCTCTRRTCASAGANISIPKTTNSIPGGCDTLQTLSPFSGWRRHPKNGFPGTLQRRPSAVWSSLVRSGLARSGPIWSEVRSGLRSGLRSGIWSGFRSGLQSGLWSGLRSVWCPVRLGPAWSAPESGPGPGPGPRPGLGPGASLGSRSGARPGPGWAPAEANLGPRWARPSGLFRCPVVYSGAQWFTSGFLQWFIRVPMVFGERPLSFLKTSISPEN